MDYIPGFVYTGNKYGYGREGIRTEYKDELLFKLWNELNSFKFNGELTSPNFIIFAKTCFKGRDINSYGYFQSTEISRKCGIVIGIEDYYHNGIESIKKILLHEMVHQYLWQNNKEKGDNTESFVYYCGWFRAELYHDEFIVSDDCKSFVAKYGLDVL